ncbi:MAG: hypothetical protein M3Q99_14160 [Acidobacteriota bacterium]|nr:hypothetical protein [Acidobacteriota bacterium]
MKTSIFQSKVLFAFALMIIISVIQASAQTTEFAYQGKLTDGGNAASGTYQMQFALFDAVSAGTQSGATLTFDGAGANPAAVSVVAGAFTVSLDFGTSPFAAGANRWLEIRVFNTATSAYVTLTPRQQLTAAPYSIRSSSANAADSLSGNCVLCVTNAQINSVDGSKVSGGVAQAANATNAVTAGNALNLGNIPASGYLPTTGGTVTGSLTVNGVLSGNGSGLTNLPGIGGFSWQEITGTSVQAQSNRGYTANNDNAQVTVTLPSAPNVGDIVRVSGAGAGGWKIAQNAGQTIYGVNFDFSKGWTPRESNRQWNSVASSSDGAKLAAVVYGGQIYTSIDSGANWTPRESNRNWQAVTSSANGSKLAAVVQSGQIYTSVDSGATWTPRESNRNWQAVTSSLDGTKLAAVAFGEQIYTSIDSGATWTPRQSGRQWNSVASSIDGTKLVAVANIEPIYTSVDSGVTWTPRAGIENWKAVASSSDGTKLVAVVQSGQIYTSVDSGATWTPRESNRNWQAVTSSLDGTKLAAVVSNGQIYTSISSGVTWTPREIVRNWDAVTSSSDGAKLVAVVSGGQIYTTYSNSTIGVNGYLSGNILSAVELQYVGGGKFIWLSHEGEISAF